MSMLYRFPGGRAKALTLSYDDGVEQDARLMEIMDRHGIRGTFNLNSGLYAPEGAVYPEGQIHRRLSASAVRKLYANPNHEVASHALTHASFPDLNPAQMAWEVLADRRNLEEMFGHLVRGFAYPFGTYNEETAQALRAAGLAYGRTIVSTGTFDIPENWHMLHPTCHHNDPALFALCDRFLYEPVRLTSRLFYLWGHSYEFEAQDNWSVIERFCETMGGRDDIWYATNIEIVDYMNACRSLRSSADCALLENPTAIDVWVEVGKQTLCVGAGKTVRV